MLCQIIRQQLGGSGGASSSAAHQLRHWRAALALIHECRYMCSLLLVCTTSGLVLYRGSDALSICLNGLTVLFVLEADNMLYTYGFSDQIRSALEGRLKVLAISQNDDARMEGARLVQLFIVPFFSIGVLLLFGRFVHLVWKTAVILGM